MKEEGACPLCRNNGEDGCAFGPESRCEAPYYRLFRATREAYEIAKELEVKLKEDYDRVCRETETYRKFLDAQRRDFEKMLPSDLPRVTIVGEFVIDKNK